MAQAAAAEACATDSGMSLGSWNAPATYMPGLDVASGASRSGPAETEFVQLHAQLPGHFLHAGGGPQPHAEHHQVELLLLFGADFVEVANARRPVAGHLDNPRGDGADELHAVLVAGAVDVAVELLAERPHVHAEDGDFKFPPVRVLQGDHRLFGGAHAADGRAVAGAAGRIAAAHALDERDALHRAAIRGALDDSAGGTRRGEHPLELDAREHVGIAPVAELAPQRRLELLETGRENHAAHVELAFHNLLIVANGARRTGFHALHALAAQAARQAAPGFGNGLLRGVALVDLGEGALPRGQVHLRHGDAVFPRRARLGIAGRLGLRGRPMAHRAGLPPRR